MYRSRPPGAMCDPEERRDHHSESVKPPPRPNELLTNLAIVVAAVDAGPSSWKRDKTPHES